jgi:hypothetical protein
MVYHEIYVWEEVESGKATLRTSTQKNIEFYELKSIMEFGRKRILISFLIPTIFLRYVIKMDVTPWEHNPYRCYTAPQKKGIIELIVSNKISCGDYEVETASNGEEIYFVEESLTMPMGATKGKISLAVPAVYKEIKVDIEIIKDPYYKSPGLRRSHEKMPYEIARRTHISDRMLTNHEKLAQIAKSKPVQNKNKVRKAHNKKKTQ